VKPTPGEADKQWLLGYGPVPDDLMEWFLERVGIRCDSGLTAMQARNLTYTEYLKKVNNSEN
jgi:hypothetical protein